MQHTEEQRALWRAAWSKRYSINRQKILKQKKKNYLRNKAYYSNYYKIKKPKVRPEVINRSKYVANLKSTTPCADCQTSYPAYVMDFDHLPQYKKFKNVSNLMANYSNSTLLREIAKCEIVCANCHRERTHNRKRNRKIDA